MAALWGAPSPKTDAHQDGGTPTATGALENAGVVTSRSDGGAAIRASMALKTST
jgi:hypothetical protein